MARKLYYAGTGESGYSGYSGYTGTDSPAVSAVTLSGNTLGITIDNGGSVITTGEKGDIFVPFSCTIVGASILTSQVGSLVIDIWKDSVTNYPPTSADSIITGTKLTLLSSSNLYTTNLSAWNTTINSGETIRFNVVSADTITRATVQLFVQRNTIGMSGYSGTATVSAGGTDGQIQINNNNALSGIDGTGTGTVVRAIYPTLSGVNQTGSSITGYYPVTNYIIDVSKSGNTFSATSSVTLSFSTSAPASGTATILKVTADTTDRTITIPSVWSFNRNNFITSFLVTASTTVVIGLEYTGSRWEVYGDPIDITGTGSFVRSVYPTLSGYSQTGSERITYSTILSSNARIDVSKPGNYFPANSSVTLTFSTSAPASGTRTLLKIEAFGSDRTITIPSVWSIYRKSNITTLNVTVNNTLVVGLEYTGSRWEIYGDPVDTTGSGAYVLNTSPTISGTAQLSGTLQLAKNSTIALNTSGAADGDWTGISIIGAAGSAVTFGTLCYLNTDKMWYPATASVSTNSNKMLGMCVQTIVTSGVNTRMLLVGNIRADVVFPTFTISAPVFMSNTAGEVTVTAPSGTSETIRVVGFGLATDELYFNPSFDAVVLG